MGADAILWIAIGTLLVLGYVAVYATVLCRKALRDGGNVEVEVKASSLSVRLVTTGIGPAKHESGGESQHDPTPHR